MDRNPQADQRVKHSGGRAEPAATMRAASLPLLTLCAAPLLSCCATWEATQRFPEATAALIEALLTDMLSLFTFFL